MDTIAFKLQEKPKALRTHESDDLAMIAGQDTDSKIQETSIEDGNSIQQINKDMDLVIARLSLNQFSDHSGLVKSSDLVFSNMDLLMLILLRLPLRKLMQFKCVSKSWLSLISSTPPPSGLFVQRPYDVTSSDPVFYFPLRDKYNDLTRRDHYVYNPTTNQLATLPRPTDWSLVYSLSLTLAFHPSNSPHYQVIACATMPQSESPVRLWQFEIYSSETKSWRVSGQPFPEPDGIGFTQGVYCNGSVYWLSELKSEAYSADCLFFDLKEERLKKFPKPPIRLTLSSRRSSYFGKSGDHLHFIEAVLSLVRRDRFIEDDSLVVLDIPGKVIRYNLVKRNFEEICEHKVLVDQHTRNGFGFGCLKVWQYVECHSSV
ncbi:hypothetical protein POM88_037720 [Heracleum sosnowskyi]|uniref:F-box protein n=1 Tax=Heracleum sosnowskyi TaxID=360622 RepID=A0AAD8MGZ4_9APIA|nr:hypothetical protein POM88_037720 [Heracleum sosnowskyi]